MISWIKIWVCCCKYINEIEFQHPPPNLHSPPPKKKCLLFIVKSPKKWFSKKNCITRATSTVIQRDMFRNPREKFEVYIVYCQNAV